MLSSQDSTTLADHGHLYNRLHFSQRAKLPPEQPRLCPSLGHSEAQARTQGAPRPRAAKPLCPGSGQGGSPPQDGRLLLGGWGQGGAADTRTLGTHCLLDAGLHLLAQQAFEHEGVAELLGLRGRGQDPGRLSSFSGPVH